MSLTVGTGFCTPYSGVLLGDGGASTSTVFKTGHVSVGFGSMLRAIGAQIEKTTNREACRDLSGRRLRDINHETRLRRWVARQAEREAKKKEPRKEPPRHQLNDPDYDKIRDQLPDRVQEAVSHGLSVSSKRPSTSNDKGAPPEKRHRRAPLMIGLEELPSSSEDEKESLSKGQHLFCRYLKFHIYLITKQ